VTTHAHPQDLPRPVLAAAGALVVFAILIAALARNGRPESAAIEPASIVASYDVQLLAQQDGAIVPVLPGGYRLPVIDVEHAGFVSGVVRGLARGRKLAAQDPNGPYRLVRMRDGRLLLIDPGTGTSIELGLFGSDNARIFATMWRTADARAVSSRH